MNMPNFHDGHFDGLWIGPNKLLRLFLRIDAHQSFVLSLNGVQALTFSEVKAGNIILDLVLRDAQEVTPSDIEELYGVTADTPQAKTLLNNARDKNLQLLELNPSYGAQGLILFETWTLNERTDEP